MNNYTNIDLYNLNYINFCINDLNLLPSFISLDFFPNNDLVIIRDPSNKIFFKIKDKIYSEAQVAEYQESL